MELQFLIESEDVGANEIYDAVYTIEKRKSLSDYIAEIMAKLLFHLDCICIIMTDSPAENQVGRINRSKYHLFCQNLLFYHIVYLCISRYLHTAFFRRRQDIYVI